MTRLIFATLIAVVLLLDSSFVVATPQSDKHEQMLYPVVRILISGGNGSGTVIYSAERDGEVHTYVLTNNHVISGAVTVGKEWDSKKGKKVDKERRVPVKIEWFDYNDLSRQIGTHGRTADIVAYNKDMDLALIRSRDAERVVPHVAHLLPADAPIYLFDEIFAVGAGLGHPPFTTDGRLSLLDEQIKGFRYLLSSAPIIFGNSGGALYRWDDGRELFELVGVPSAIRAAGWNIVPHMAFSIPMETIREFLIANDFGFIIGVEPEEKDDEDNEDDDES